MFRRLILIASSLISLAVLSAAPAGAQSYADTLSEGEVRTATVTFEVTTFEFTTFDELARTGSDNVVPLAQAGIVLLGGGSLLVLVAKRRRTERRNAAV